GSKRRPDRSLAFTRDRAREEQVRDVGAGDEQHETHSREREEQRPSHLTHGHIANRDRNRYPRSALSDALGPGALHRVKIRFGARERHAWTKPSDQLGVSSR